MRPNHFNITPKVGWKKVKQSYTSKIIILPVLNISTDYLFARFIPPFSSHQSKPKTPIPKSGFWIHPQLQQTRSCNDTTFSQSGRISDPCQAGFKSYFIRAKLGQGVCYRKVFKTQASSSDPTSSREGEGTEQPKNCVRSEKEQIWNSPQLEMYAHLWLRKTPGVG